MAIQDHRIAQHPRLVALGLFLLALTAGQRANAEPTDAFELLINKEVPEDIQEKDVPLAKIVSFKELWEKMKVQVTARYPVLVPFSRSLQEKKVGAERPRVLYGGMTENGRLFIGHAAGKKKEDNVNEIEVIAWDAEKQAYRFHLLETPKNQDATARKHETKCGICHQHGAGIFPRSGWQESLGTRLISNVTVSPFQGKFDGQAFMDNFGTTPVGPKFKGVRVHSAGNDDHGPAANTPEAVEPFDVEVRLSSRDEQLGTICKMICQEGTTKAGCRKAVVQSALELLLLNKWNEYRLPVPESNAYRQIVDDETPFTKLIGATGFQHVDPPATYVDLEKDVKSLLGREIGSPPFTLQPGFKYTSGVLLDRGIKQDNYFVGFAVVPVGHTLDPKNLDPMNYDELFTLEDTRGSEDKINGVKYGFAPLPSSDEGLLNPRKKAPDFTQHTRPNYTPIPHKEGSAAEEAAYVYANAIRCVFPSPALAKNAHARLSGASLHSREAIQHALADHAVDQALAGEWPPRGNARATLVDALVKAKGQ
jgi:hypothetical protein